MKKLSDIFKTSNIPELEKLIDKHLKKGKAAEVDEETVQLMEYFKANQPKARRESS